MYRRARVGMEAGVRSIDATVEPETRLLAPTLNEGPSNVDLIESRDLVGPVLILGDAQGWRTRGRNGRVGLSPTAVEPEGGAFGREERRLRRH